MSRDSGVNLRWTILVVAAAALLATGADATHFGRRTGHPSPLDQRQAGAKPSTPPAGTPTAPAASAPSGSPVPDIVVTLSQDAVNRASITQAPVDTARGAAGLRLPGVIEPNAYRQVTVTPIVAGRVTRVLVDLGEHVKRGQTIAQVFSPELAESHTRYTSARAELEARERELQRTQKLVEIGAASRQELERINAEYAAQTAAVQSARSQLELLGVSPAGLDAGSGKDVAASANVPAPIAGVVTERVANVGLNVESASKLFTVVDLSTVWVVADLYEKDFSRVRVGSPATITTAAYPDLVLKGRVGYIDPQVSVETRTAKLRVEVQNPRNALRLGMYADVGVNGGETNPMTVIPRSAVQTVGDRQVVYLVDPKQAGRFTEREVRLGQAAGEQIEVLSGVQPGDVVVTEGSFFVRAERERLGLRSPADPTGSAESAGAGTTQGEAGTNVQTAKVIVGERGYEPARVTLRARTPARITFVRTTDKTCGTEVVFSSLNIERALPLNQPVVIEFTPAKSGDIAFACGMNMLHGTLGVR
jgi:membrane fusion protein, heavy metal efflux system